MKYLITLQSLGEIQISGYLEVHVDSVKTGLQSTLNLEKQRLESQGYLFSKDCPLKEVVRYILFCSESTQTIPNCGRLSDTEFSYIQKSK